jgi:hypothetical protein
MFTDLNLTDMETGFESELVLLDLDALDDFLGNPACSRRASPRSWGSSSTLSGAGSGSSRKRDQLDSSAGDLPSTGSPREPATVPTHPWFRVSGAWSPVPGSYVRASGCLAAVVFSHFEVGEVNGLHYSGACRQPVGKGTEEQEWS